MTDLTAESERFIKGATYGTGPDHFRMDGHVEWLRAQLAAIEAAAALAATPDAVSLTEAYEMGRADAEHDWMTARLVIAEVEARIAALEGALKRWLREDPWLPSAWAGTRPIQWECYACEATLTKPPESMYLTGPDDAWHIDGTGREERCLWLVTREALMVTALAAQPARADLAEPLRAALVTIRDQGGAVCPDFETCRHVSCRSSYAAWHVADMALSPEEPR